MRLNESIADYFDNRGFSSIGSLQLDEIYDHNHPSLFDGQYSFAKPNVLINGYTGGDNSVNYWPTTGNFGGSESRVNNLFLNMFIKY
ncbi:hypothetical protein [Rickettsiella massiliensis]|uniref:hypothetical protein n=1 Tax=Rickettsiella massiliensis TaxID=676517 RepID=UPI0012EA9C53|nr:hypothetical protein [Rickettsiella massiliensis]